MKGFSKNLVAYVVCTLLYVHDIGNRLVDIDVLYCSYFVTTIKFTVSVVEIGTLKKHNL